MIEPNLTLGDRAAALLFDHGRKTALVVRGEDKFSWLQGVLTADIRTCDEAPGDTGKGRTRAVRSLCLDRLGKIKGELLVLKRDDAYYLLVIGGDPGQVLAHLEQLLVMEDVELSTLEGRLFSAHDEPLGDRLIARAEHHQAIHASLSWLSEEDTVVFSPIESGTSLPLEDNAVALGSAEWEQFRIQRGLPIWGVDYTHSDNPGTAGLVSVAVSQTKGCYLGQEVVCKLLMRGALRESTCLLRFESQPRVGAEVCLREDRATIGTLTSVGLPTPSGVFALGRLRTNAIDSAAAVISGDVPGQILPRNNAL